MEKTEILARLAEIASVLWTDSVQASQANNAVASAAYSEALSMVDELIEAAKA